MNSFSEHAYEHINICKIMCQIIRHVPYTGLYLLKWVWQILRQKIKLQQILLNTHKFQSLLISFFFVIKVDFINDLNHSTKYNGNRNGHLPLFIHDLLQNKCFSLKKWATLFVYRLTNLNLMFFVFPACKKNTKFFNYSS